MTVAWEDQNILPAISKNIYFERLIVNRKFGAMFAHGDCGKDEK